MYILTVKQHVTFPGKHNVGDDDGELDVGFIVGKNEGDIVGDALGDAEGDILGF